MLIAGYLKNIGWRVKESIGRTLAAEYGSEKWIYWFKVDMDALPIEEFTDLSFPLGLMESCMHAAMIFIYVLV